MTSEPRTLDARWMAAGLVFVAVLGLVLWRFHQDPAKQLAFKATRADLVSRLQVGLAATSEAEKSAVLSVTDPESQRFADQARAVSARMEQERQQLAALLASGGTQRERELLAQFSQAFGALRQVDDEVLELAVKNSNLKAYALLFGPAAAALADLEGALERLATKRAASPYARQVTSLAFTARVGLLHVQTLLAPHIAEESDPRMDQLEATMREQSRRVREALDQLARLPGLAGDADLAAASASFARYGELESRILALSRENTNVRSLALSLGQRRKAALLCAEPLDALQQAILDEPIAGVSYGRVPTR